MIRILACVAVMVAWAMPVAAQQSNPSLQALPEASLPPDQVDTAPQTFKAACEMQQCTYDAEAKVCTACGGPDIQDSVRKTLNAQATQNACLQGLEGGAC